MAGILDLPNADVLLYLAETYAIEEDFERWNTTGWTENENGDGTLTVPSSVAVKRQNYGMRSEIGVTASRNSAAIYKTFTNGSNDAVYVNFWFRLNSTTLDEDDVTIIMFTTSGLSVLGKLEIVEESGILFLRLADYGVDTYGTSSHPLTLGTWHHVRVGLKCHNTAGVVYLELDGTVIENQTGIETSYNGDTIAAIFMGLDNLYMTGYYSAQADFDEVYVALAQISVNVEPYDETILSISLHLGCTNEVSSFDIMIDRGNPTYDNSIDPGEANALSTGLECDIYLGRGTNKPLLLTGQIDEIEYYDEVVDYSFRNVCMIRGRCNGHQLFGKHYDGDLISDVGTAQLNYKRTSGDSSSMVAYLIDNYTSLLHVRVQDLMGSNAASSQKDVVVTDGTVFTDEQLVKIEDDNGWEYNQIESISSNTLSMHNNLTRAYATADNGKVWVDLIEECDTAFTKLEYIDTIIYEIIRYIAEVTDLAGVVGFDFRVDYDGKFAFFSKGTKAESYTLQDECQLNRYLKDGTRVRNKIIVKGKADKPYPLDSDGQEWADGWTELATPSTVVALSQDASSEQKIIKVAEGASSVFSVNDYVYIKDSNAPTNYGEMGQIQTITLEGGQDDSITISVKLTNTYTTAKWAIVWLVETATRWGFNPQGATDDITITGDGSVKYTGSYSVKAVGNNANTAHSLMLPLLSSEHFSANDYEKLKLNMYFTTTAPVKMMVYLFSGDLTGSGDYAAYMSGKTFSTKDINGWQELEMNIGTKYASEWFEAGSFDWTDISMIYITVWYAAAGTYTFYIDRLHAVGKRWGSGTDDATVDGFAEDSTSQTAYTVKELIIINDLLLSDAECENKAQALIDFYADERIIIEAESSNIDWEAYHPMAAQKVAVDLDQLGVTGSSYRIDSIDIQFGGRDNTLVAVFTLGKTPLKLADYLYKLSERQKLLERKYDQIR